MSPRADAPLPALWEDLTFLSPLSDQRADAQAAWLAEGLGSGTVLDVGCGWGELLLRVLARASAATAIGVDLEPLRLQEARRRAAARGLGERARFVTGDASGEVRDRLPPVVDALVVSGASQVWGPPVEEGRPLDYGAALAAVRAHVHRGARVLYADAIWSRPPTPAAVAPLSGRDDEFATLHELTELAVEHGFAVVAFGESSLEEWDAFESGFGAGVARWLDRHGAAHPEAGAVAARAADQRAAYLQGYRGVLGYAHLQLLAV